MTNIKYSIPQDLMIEILLRLPAKSVLRFRFVSKLWCSIISSQLFIDAFMSLSLTRPRVIFTLRDYDGDRMFFFQRCSFFSSSSMLVAEKYSLKMSKAKDYINHICKSVRGFICCQYGNRVVVCNPTTGQVIHLDEMNYDNYNLKMYLGYDPNSDQYKVLRIMSLKFSNSHIEHSVVLHSVRTLGSQRSSNPWRHIKTSIIYYCHYLNGECIDGVLYYTCNIIQIHRKICSFDVGSEIVSLIETPEELSSALNNYLSIPIELTNYIGKLAVYCHIDNGFNLWVLDDVKNQVWSKKTYIFQSFTPSMFWNFHFKGVTTSGEIVYAPFVYAPRFFFDSLELLCCDVEKKMEKSVRVEGFSKIGLFFPSILCSYVDSIVYL